MNEDEKIWLRTKDGQEYFIYKTEKCDMQKELTETINKLQNNWNELKKWLEDTRKYETWCEMAEAYNIIINKMQELEGNNE